MWSVAQLSQSWTWWTSETTFFAIVTAKPALPLILQHPMQVSNTTHTLLFLGLVNTLYGLLIMPFPRTIRAKQFCATLLLLALVLFPILICPPSVVVRQSQSAGAMAIAMRMIDLYFVRPRRQDIQAQQNNKKSDNHVDTTKSKSSPLMWDSIQLNAELWSPLRKISSTHVSSYDATKPGLIPLRQLLKQVGLYLLISDLTIFLASRFTLQDLPSLSLIQYGLFLCLFGFIHFAVLLLYNLVAVTWSLATGHRVDPEEWILISKPLPYFAKTPAEFWALWHSLFRTIWVDLGFLPAQNFAKRHLGPDRLGPQLARVVRLSLPVMAVFTLSGILHGYVVLATWRENPWSQVVYFLIQGVVVILTKAIEQSAFGLILQKKYHQGTHLQRTLMKISGILLTWCLHIITAPFFLHPYLQNEIWLTVTKGSVLWNLFG